MGFGDYSLGLKARDAIASIAAATVERLRPTYRYGTVSSIDNANNRCQVLLAGDPSPVWVRTGYIRPTATGQVVRVEGYTGDKFVSDVYGGPKSVPNETRMPGEIRMWATATAPDGWLRCEGQAISRTTYSNLFAIIGTTYGVGNGSTTFNLPDFIGRVPVGPKSDRTEMNGLGKKGGAFDHTLTTAEMPVHNHGLSGHTWYWGSSGSISLISQPQAQASAATGNGLFTWQGQKGWNSTLDTGNGQAHNNVQPFQTVNFIIAT